MSFITRIAIPLAGALSLAARASADWELRRDDLNPPRPPVQNGIVTIDAAAPGAAFPRYLNELGIKAIRIRFREPQSGRRGLSILWTGGSEGADRFSVAVDGVTAGVSRTIDSPRRPYAWYRDDFAVALGPGTDHIVEIDSIPECSSPIEFAGIRLAAPDAAPYQPLCYEAIATLERYEAALGGKGTAVFSPHLSVFAPQRYAAQAKALSAFLEKAYEQLRVQYGCDSVFRFSVEHYPAGHPRGWGGISGAGTIGYPVEALQRFGDLGTRDVRGFAGYTEEMSHGFASIYHCEGTYEALGVAVQEDVVRNLVPAKVADAFWLPEHAKWDETHRAYLAAGRKNPDEGKYPNSVLYTRILNDVFLRLRTEYGPNLWPDFFAMVRQMDYPLHRAKATECLRTYADLFSAMFGRDMRAEFEKAGIDLAAEPPWGWQTRGTPKPSATPRG